MVWQKLGSRSAPAPPGQFRVVRHRPLRRALLSLLLMGVVVAAAGFGYWLGGRHSELDQTYLAALETRGQALDARVKTLERALADARLAQSVDAQAARSLRETISELRHQLGALDEEVTFYKSLMAPSRIERGLQIAEFDLAAGRGDNEFTYHLLLTQAAQRRDWIQGSVRLDVHGLRAGPDGAAAEAVLPLTELASLEDYPLRFRFRYFQDLSGTLRIPDGFQPNTVVVTAKPRGRSADPKERSFDWIVPAG